MWRSCVRVREGFVGSDGVVSTLTSFEEEEVLGVKEGKRGDDSYVGRRGLLSGGA